MTDTNPPDAHAQSVVCTKLPEYEKFLCTWKPAKVRATWRAARDQNDIVELPVKILRQLDPEWISFYWSEFRSVRDYT